jgi:hypothetical protein
MPRTFPTFVLVSLLALVACGPDAPRPDVLLVTIDTTRAGPAECH